MARRNDNAEGVAHAVLDSDGSVVAADSTFYVWLGTRSVAEMLPNVEGDMLGEPGSKPVQLFRAKQNSIAAQMEWIPLAGKWGHCQLVRIQTVESAASDYGYYRDAVTGLPDRRALEIHRSTWLTTDGAGAPHALLFLDLDNFKRVNDQYGHACGDKVLATLAERWQKSIRNNDLVVRYGGDEFVILLANVRTRAEAQSVVDRFMQVTSVPIPIDDTWIETGVTIGVALADDLSVPLDQLISSADKAMYAAKPRNA